MENNVKTKDILKWVGLGLIIVSSTVAPGSFKLIWMANKLLTDKNKSKVKTIIKRLDQQRMISYQEIAEGKIAVNLTEKGDRRRLEADFENIELKKKKSDGKWRLVIFDIPERNKNARDVFSRKLLQLGLTRLQDSVFVGPYPCKNEIDFLCHFLNISEFVTIVPFNHIERGKSLTLR